MSEMNPDLSPAVAPGTLDPQAYALHTGSPQDDDGLAIDDYFRAADHAPVVSESLQVAKESTKPATRIIHNRINVINQEVGSSLRSVMLFPQDLNRLSLHLYASANFFYSDQPFSVPYFSGTAVFDPTRWGLVNAVAVFVPTAAEFILDDHTGPLYVSAPSDGAGSGFVTIQGSAITR